MILEFIFLLFGIVGNTSHYAEHVMDWQVDYHQLTPPCDGCAVASVGCDHIGETWLLLIDGELVPVVVADCAGDWETIEWMEGNNILLELSFELARRFDCVGTSCRVSVIKGGRQ